MSPTEHHQLEKLKERLIAFLKTLPKLIADDNWSTYAMRLDNCVEIQREILGIIQSHNQKQAKGLLPSAPLDRAAASPSSLT